MPDQVTSNHGPKIEMLLDVYLNHMQSTVEKVKSLLKDGYQIAFYGFGNIFLCAYTQIQNALGEGDYSRDFFILDDTPSKIGGFYKNIPIHSMNHLTQNAGQKMAVMICTMNRQHHMAMEVRLKEILGKDAIILSPWSSSKS